MYQNKQKRRTKVCRCSLAQLAVLTLVFFSMQPMLYGGIDGTINFTNGSSLSGIGGDRVWGSPAAGIPCRGAGLVTNGMIETLYDIKSAKILDAILIMNATNAASNINADRAAIRVANDEYASGFDYTDVASYTVLVFSNSVLPRSNATSTLREAVLTQRLKRRYYLVQHTHNMWGVVENPAPGKGDSFEVRLHTMTYRIAPPTGTFLTVR